MIKFPTASATTSLFKIDEEFELECGAKFNSLTLSYSTYGQLNEAGDNVIWVCHALTADANPKDWWQGLVGEHDLYNPDEYFIVCANVIGSPYGSTSPLNCDADKRFTDFPIVSIRDNVKAFIELRKHLGIDKIHTLIGGSMGGHQALEWAIIETQICENLILLATSAVLSPWAMAFNQSQRLALKADGSWGDKSAQAAQNGLKAARSIALLSYRNAQAYNQTQADDYDFHRQAKVVSYQNYQGDKLVSRFNAYSYYALTQSMDSHDIGRKRGGVVSALAQIKCKTLVIGIDSDYLFSVADSRLLADFIPHAELTIISSDFGHDGFLIEQQKITAAINKFHASTTQNNETLGLFGLGCVGQGVFQLISHNKSMPQIKYVGVKHEFKARKIAFDKVTTDHQALVNSDAIETIIEVISNNEQAYHIAKSAMNEGKNFISASKKMLAYHLPEIISWNKKYSQSFLYEAAVGGSIPIIRNLDLYFEQAQNQSIKAILNGSSNYILTHMFAHDKSYNHALAQAQEKGFAESNPMQDVGGFDAKYKAIILAAHAFGIIVHPDDVFCFGIENISSADLNWARAKAWCIKQVASITRTNKGIIINVMPELVTHDSELAKTDDENNLLILENNATKFYFKGAGAGGIATATAVLADVKASCANYRYTYNIDENLCLDNDVKINVWIKNSDFSAQVGEIIEQDATHVQLRCNYKQLRQLQQQDVFFMKDAESSL